VRGQPLQDVVQVGPGRTRCSPIHAITRSAVRLIQGTGHHLRPVLSAPGAGLRPARPPWGSSKGAKPHLLESGHLSGCGRPRGFDDALRRSAVRRSRSTVPTSVLIRQRAATRRAPCPAGLQRPLSAWQPCAPAARAAPSATPPGGAAAR
jgi:hypothetical protein